MWYFSAFMFNYCPCGFHHELAKWFIKKPQQLSSLVIALGEKISSGMFWSWTQGVDLTKTIL
jgi:hypothetical protein